MIEYKLKVVRKGWPWKRYTAYQIIRREDTFTKYDRNSTTTYYSNTVVAESIVLSEVLQALEELKGTL